MKKVYIEPSAKAICLAYAENVLLSMSMNGENTGDVEGGMTQEQHSSSIWDNWSE